MLNDSAKHLNKRILDNLLAEREYCRAKGNVERLEWLEVAILQHKRMIMDEYGED